MDRERAKDVCNSYGHPHIKDDEGNVVATLARTDKKTVEEIEGLSDDELLRRTKGCIFMLNDVGVISISDLQREQLYYLELEEREMMDELEAHFEREEKMRNITEKELEYLSNEELIERTIDLEKLYNVIDENDDEEETSDGCKLLEYLMQEIYRRDLFHHYLSEKHTGEDEEE